MNGNDETFEFGGKIRLQFERFLKLKYYAKFLVETLSDFLCKNYFLQICLKNVFVRVYKT
jgi:hypothetical protein